MGGMRSGTVTVESSRVESRQGKNGDTARDANRAWSSRAHNNDDTRHNEHAMRIRRKQNRAHTMTIDRESRALLTVALTSGLRAW
jgi:predicted lysophospholipase L1 biosynthesis ABC-type transport system permease subunit